MFGTACLHVETKVVKLIIVFYIVALFRERKMCNLRAVFVGDKKRVYEREETDRDLLFDECYQQYRL